MAIRPDYSVGTVSLAAGGTIVTGVGTLWAAADIQPGDTFKVQNLDAIILSIDSNTQITLRETWTGSALAGASYAIRYQPDGSRYAAAARTLIELLGNGNLTAFASLAGALNMVPMFAGAGALTLVPRSELTQGVDYDVQVDTLAERAGYDGQAAGFTVLVSDVGDGRAAIYSKASGTLGDWTEPAFITGPSGSFQSKGNWNNATAYNIGDVVFYQGSSWIALVDHTNHAPPSLPTTVNTWWTILSKAGSSFTYRGNYSGATAYLKDDVVTDQGSIWIALQPTTGNAPPLLPTNSNANWQLLVQGAGTFKGAYSGATAYKAGDIVFDQNSSWIALQATIGNAPPILPATSNAYWNAMAVRGTGDVSGPASSILRNVPMFNATTGKILADSGLSVDRIKGDDVSINGDFLVFQRGGVFNAIANGQFVADRWCVLRDGTGNINTTFGVFPLGQTDVPGNPATFLNFQQTTAGSGMVYNLLKSPIEDVRQLAGKQVTVTWYMRNNGGSNITFGEFLLNQIFGTGGSPSVSVPNVLASNVVLPTGGVWIKFQYVITLPSVAGKTLGSNNDHHLGFFIRNPINTVMNWDISHFSLMEGDWSWHPDPKPARTQAEELIRCMRYYEQMNGPGTGAVDTFLIGRADGVSQSTHIWDFKVVKRAVPTIGVTAPASGSGTTGYSPTTSKTQFLFSGAQALAAISTATATAEMAN